MTRQWPSRPGHARRHDLGPVRAQRPERPCRAVQLVLHGAALPCHEDAAGGEQRQAQLDQLGERGHGPSRHRRPGLAVPRVAGDRLGPLRLRGHPSLEARRLDHGPQELDLLADRVHEQRPVGAERRREREPGEPATGAEVEDPPDAASPEVGHGREAVEDVETRDLGRVADRREIDRDRPGEQQPDVGVDHGARVVGKVDAQGPEPVVEDTRVLVGERREVLNARRERNSRAVQGTLLWLH